MVNIVQRCLFRRPCAREDRVVNGEHLQGRMVWFHEDTARDYSQTEYGKNVPVVWGLRMATMVKILSDADSRRQCVRDGFEKVESNDWRGKIAHGFRRIQSETTVRQNMWRTLLWLVTEIRWWWKSSGDTNWRWQCAREDRVDSRIRTIESETTVR